jgi:hypothetical protein
MRLALTSSGSAIGHYLVWLLSSNEPDKLIWLELAAKQNFCLAVASLAAHEGDKLKSMKLWECAARLGDCEGSWILSRAFRRKDPIST